MRIFPNLPRATVARASAVPTLKDFVVLVPLLAATLAIMFDVGYFSEFDLSYFTFFSLSEHIVFALQVLPHAALLAALLMYITYQLGLVARIYTSIRRRESGRLFGPGYAVFLAVIGIAGACFVWWMGSYVSLAIQLTTVGFLMIAVLGIAFTRVVLTLAVGAAALFMAFAMGKEYAREKKNHAVSHVIRMDSGPDLSRSVVMVLLTGVARSTYDSFSGDGLPR
jgi:hypothetical protein